MKKIAILLATCALPGALLAGDSKVVIEDPVCAVPFTGSVSVGYESTYLFRGYDYGDDAPWAGIDLNYAITDTVSLNFGTWYINPTNDPVDFDELDVYAFLKFPVWIFDAAVGGTWFYYPEPSAEAGEFLASLTYSFPFVDLTGTAVYDETTDGFYYELAGGKSIPLLDCLSLGLKGGISYGDNYYGVDSFNHAFARTTLTYMLTETAALSAYIGGNFPLDDLEAQGQDDDLHGGASLTVSF